MSFLSTVNNHIKVRANAKYACGHYVRISKYKSIFSKVYTENWSAEIFQVVKVNNTNPVTYQLQDEPKQRIFGGFYEYELQKVKYPNVYLVDKVERKGDKVLVKWFGMDSTSWINKDNKIN